MRPTPQPASDEKPPTVAIPTPALDLLDTAWTNFAQAVTQLDAAIHRVMEGRHLQPGELTRTQLDAADNLTITHRLATWLTDNAPRYGWTPDKLQRLIDEPATLTRVIYATDTRQLHGTHPETNPIPSDILTIAGKLTNLQPDDVLAYTLRYSYQCVTARQDSK